MKPNQTDLVGEYLHEVDLRLSGLPLLQRRELLADLAAHIATERTEREAHSEGELIEILERLGSPEVVAAAAYEEAGAGAAHVPAAAPAGPPPKRTGWIFTVLAIVGVVLALCLFGALATFRSDSPPEPASPASPAGYATPPDAATP